MAKTGAVADDVAASDFFPQIALPSKWKGWRRFLRPFPIQNPRSPQHHTVQAHIRQVITAWSALTAPQKADWDTWAAANKPEDEIWEGDMAWTGQLAHAFCNAHLLFIGAPLRTTAPSVSPGYPPAVTAAWWTDDPGNQLGVTWTSLGDASLSVLVSLRFFASPKSLKSPLYCCPIAAVAHPDHGYGIDGPPGLRVWWALYVLHNTQGVISPVSVFPVNKGETL